MIPPVLIISLSNPSNLIQDLNKKHNICAKWSKGVNGKKLSDLDRLKYTSTFFNYFGPSGAIGCAQAHINAWKHYISNFNDDDMCIFFEDDVILTNNFVIDLNKALEDLPSSDFDLLGLGYFGNWSTASVYSKIFDIVNFGINRVIYQQDINQYWKIPHVFLGLHAYILSKKGAKKLIELFEYKIDSHIDQKISHYYLQDKIKLYVLKERIAFQSSTNECVSLNTPSSKHPMLINLLLKDIDIDSHFKLVYTLHCVFLQITPLFQFNLMSILFMILGFIFGLFNISLYTIILLYISISWIDIIENPYSLFFCFKNLILLLVFYFSIKAMIHMIYKRL